MSADLYRGERSLRPCAQRKCRREDRNKEAGRRGWGCHYESRSRVSRCCEEPRLLSEQRVVTGFTRIGAPASAIACLLILRGTAADSKRETPFSGQADRDAAPSIMHAFSRSDAETSHSRKAEAADSQADASVSRLSKLRRDVSFALFKFERFDIRLRRSPEDCSRRQARIAGSERTRLNDGTRSHARVAPTRHPRNHRGRRSKNESHSRAQTLAAGGQRS
jgi:hypothetical protein